MKIGRAVLRQKGQHVNMPFSVFRVCCQMSIEASAIIYGKNTLGVKICERQGKGHEWSSMVRIPAITLQNASRTACDGESGAVPYQGGIAIVWRVFRCHVVNIVGLLRSIQGSSGSCAWTRFANCFDKSLPLITSYWLNGIANRGAPKTRPDDVSL